MIQIQELIKHFVLGIVSLLICNVAMSDLTKAKNFLKLVQEVKNEYGKDSIEAKIPNDLIMTVATIESANFNFENSPTAKAANNYFGMKAGQDQEFIMSQSPTNPARVRKFEDAKDSIRAYLSLMSGDERYSEIVKSAQNNETSMEKYFEDLSKAGYAENENYNKLLNDVYRTRVKPLIETERLILPRRKPINEQMTNLQ